MPTVAPAATTKMMPYPLPPINESAFRTVQSLRSAIGTTRTAEPERSRDKPARLALILVPQEQRNSESAEIKMKNPAASGVGLNAASAAETSIMPAQKSRKPNMMPNKESVLCARARPIRFSINASASRPPSRGRKGRRFINPSDKWKEQKSWKAADVCPMYWPKPAPQRAMSRLANGPAAATDRHSDGVRGGVCSSAIKPKGCTSIEETTSPSLAAINAWDSS